MKPALLVVDDDDEICTQLRWALSKEYSVLRAADRVGAVNAFRQHRPSVVMLDLGLPPNTNMPDEGLAAMDEILSLDRRTKVVIVSGQSDRKIALQAVGRGAYDFIAKPLDLDALKLLLSRCFHVAVLEREYDELQRIADIDGFHGMLGTGAAMQTVFAAIRKVSSVDIPVLILGESGTGKEMAARAIHAAGVRRRGPFIAINCAAIPEPLLESELFGHEKGAFTGAHVQRKGRFEQAHGGTLFLDEIGEIAPSLQVKLLRFLQERTIERVGGRQEITVDARVVAATNVDLDKSIASGAFRSDLFFRLAVFKIQLPSLRERTDDVELLAQSILRRAAIETGRKTLRFSSDALQAMRRYGWPGNIRELQNRVRRAAVMCDGSVIAAADLELSGGAVQPERGSSLKEAREATERECAIRALHKHRWNISAAAAELDVSRPTLYELMERLHIERPVERSESRSALPATVP